MHEKNVKRKHNLSLNVQNFDRIRICKYGFAERRIHANHSVCNGLREGGMVVSLGWIERSTCTQDCKLTGHIAFTNTSVLPASPHHFAIHPSLEAMCEP